MNLFSFFTLVKSGRGANTVSRRRQRASKNYRCTPVLEVLEGRVQPCTIDWNVDTSGFWDVLGNWRDSGGQSRVPRPTDDVCINRATAVTVTHRQGTTRILSLRSQEAIILSGGSLSLATASTIAANLTLSGGFVGGVDPLTITGLVTWTAGGFSGPGVVNADGGITISGSDGKSVSGTILNNRGTAIWREAGPIAMWSGAVFNNLVGSRFDVQNDSFIDGDAVFNNAGMFLKTQGTGTTRFGVSGRGVTFNNTGAVQVLSGTLSLDRGGGTSSGSFSAVGTNLNFGGLFDDTYTLTGTADFDVTNLSVSGYLNLARDLTIPGLALGLGELRGGIIGGSGTLTITGRLDWTAGFFAGSGVVNANGSITISGDGPKGVYGGRILNNQGTAIWSGRGRIGLESGGVFNNLAGATFEARNDSDIFWSSSPPLGTFNNAGIFRKTTGMGTTLMSPGVVFNNLNTGSVQVLTGTLSLEGGGTSSGAISAAAGANLDFNGWRPGLGDTYTLTGTAAFDVSNLSVSEGTLNLARDLTLPVTTNLSVRGGLVGGSRTLTIHGPLNWTAGGFGGSVVVHAIGCITISGDGSKSVRGGILNNRSTAIWTGEGSIAIWSGGVFNNLAGATFEARNDSGIGGDSPDAFNNAGTFLKTGTGTTYVGYFNNTGSVQALSGTLSLDRGGTSTGSIAARNLNFVGGTYTLAGAAAFNVTNLSVSGCWVTLERHLTIPNLALRGGRVGGNGTLTVDGPMTWAAGGIATVIHANGGIGISDGVINKYIEGGTLNNRREAIWNGNGAIQIGSRGTFNNLDGATFEVRNDSSIVGDESSIFNNAGTFRKPVLSGSTPFRLGIRFNNVSTGSVVVSSGSLSLDGGGTSSGSFSGTNLNFGGGTYTLTGAASFNVTNLSVGRGDLRVERTLTLPSTTRLTLSGGLIGGAGLLTITGTVTWTSGGFSGPGMVNADGGITISGSDGKLVSGCILNNRGTVIWDGGPIAMNHGAVLNNSRVFDVRTDSSFFWYAGNLSMFNNTGTFRKDTAGTTRVVGIQFNNPDTGIVDVRGTLSLEGGGRSTGRITATNLNFGGGVYVLAGSALFSVTNLSVSGGELRVERALTLPSLTLSGGLVGGASPLMIGGAVTWTSGGFSGPGVVTAMGGITMSGDNPKLLTGGILNNQGTATWVGTGPIQMENGTVFNNTGTFLASTDSLFRWGGGDIPRFNNARMFRKLDSMGITRIVSIQFNNTGTVEVLSGSLSLDGGGQSTGQITAGNLNFGGGVYVLAGSEPFTVTNLSVSGGSLRVERELPLPRTINLSVRGGTLSVGRALTLPSTINLALSGGLIGGAGPLTIYGHLTWTAGGFSGPGVVNAEGGITMSGSDGKRVSGCILNNLGTAIWAGGPIVMDNGAVFNNTRVFETRTDSSFSGTAGNFVFNNSGTFRKLASTGTTIIGNGIELNNIGIVDVQTGALRLDGPFRQYSSATFTLTGGTYHIAGAFRFRNADIRTNAAHITLDGPAAAITETTFARDALQNFRSNAPGGSFTLRNGRNFTAPPSFVNAGTLQFLDGTTWSNPAGATFVLQPGASLLGPGRFSNAGRFRKEGAGTSTLAAEFDNGNNGTVEVGSGTLNLVGGGTSSGTWTVPVGATVNVPFNSYAFTGGSVTGQGMWLVSGGTVNISSSLSVDNLALVGGSVIAAAGTTLIASQTLIMVAGEFVGNLRLPGNSVLYWLGGALRNGSIQVAATGILTLLGDDPKFLNNYTVNNAGTIYWHDGGDIVVSNGGALNNQEGGSFDAFHDTQLRQLRHTGGAAFAINNHGMFRKSFGTGETLLGNNVTFTNWPSGRVEVWTGKLHTANGFTNAGTVTVQYETTLQITGTYTQTAGTTTVDFGTLMASGDYVQRNGTTILNQGTLAPRVRVDLMRGVLTGSGYINGHVRNAASIQVGGQGTAGTLNVYGNYTQTESGQLDIELGGLTQGVEYDYLYISGTATLAGELNISLLGVYRPAPEDVFTFLMSDGGIRDDFQTFNGLNLGDGLTLLPFTDGFGYSLWTYRE